MTLSNEDWNRIANQASTIGIILFVILSSAVAYTNVQLQQEIEQRGCEALLKSAHVETETWKQYSRGPGKQSGGAVINWSAINTSTDQSNTSLEERP